MKRLLYSLLIILSLVGISLFYDDLIYNKGETLGVDELVSPQPSPLISPTAEIYPPKNIVIPKIWVDAEIEKVGNDKEGKMDVPKNPDNVAWYEPGYKVGDKGSAVIAGHFDKASGEKAVFYDLEKLEVDDEITVTNEDGTVNVFKVVGKEIYDFDKLPLREIFLNSDKVRLNLITCDGVFNKDRKNYSQRLVIYSELQEP